MDKNELLGAIRSERARLKASLAGLTPGQMTAAGVMGEWSIKDILAHIAMWESQLVTTLFTSERGGSPRVFHGPAGVDRINAESFAQQRDRPLERVLSDFDAVHAQLLKRLKNLTDHDLSDPQRFKWMRGEPLERLIASDTYEHYAEHRPMVEAWLVRQAGDQTG